MPETITRFQTDLKPNSYDPETRTGEAVIASDRVVDGVKIDFGTFFAGGLPDTLALQPDHDNSVLEKRGEWFDLRIEGEAPRLLVARFRLSERADNDAIHTLLIEGMLRGVSIGFAVSKWTTATDASGKPHRVAETGRLLEASFVNLPADDAAQIRGLEMPKPVEEVAKRDNTKLEALARSFSLPEEETRSILDLDATDETKAHFILLAVERSQPTVRTVSTAHNDTSLDNPAILRNAVIEFYDSTNRGEAPSGPASQVFANGERGLAERLCRNAGINTLGLSDSEIVRRAATTSDFPIIAGGTFNLAMRRELEAAASPIAALFGRDTVATFNPETRGLVDWTTLAIADRLESGQYQHSYISESGETVQAAVIGGITSKSYELTVNAGARLGNDGVQFGRRMAAEIADREVAFVEQSSHAGPTMSDGTAVFDASRGNIEAFTVDASTEVSQLMGFRSDMAKRKGAGNVMIGKYPTHWLVPSEFEEAALRIVASVQASAIADVNTLAGKLQVVVEPRLNNTAKSWLVAAPSHMDGAVRVFLQGQEAPFTDSRIDFETDAVQFKIRHPFGLSWLEWRSWTRLDHAAGA